MVSFDINNYFVVYINDLYKFYLLSKDKKKNGFSQINVIYLYLLSR